MIFVVIEFNLFVCWVLIILLLFKLEFVFIELGLARFIVLLLVPVSLNIEIICWSCLFERLLLLPLLWLLKLLSGVCERFITDVPLVDDADAVVAAVVAVCARLFTVMFVELQSLIDFFKSLKRFNSVEPELLLKVSKMRLKLNLKQKRRKTINKVW